ncbi:MAG: thioredoxin-disulfide reductase [Defluviitaleaceae bacterium]|nr:thioredoxin-disulfide reductase [Defluviitaleaceae bacterium]MCL2836819.1 thioredoxin-disulfide reductase [Defluviitaleaceae bacterium]
MSGLIYDVAIIGAGPAGLAAGLYAARARLDAVIFEKLGEGGQIAITNEIENYPGAPANSSGPSLSGRMAEQAREFGAKIIRDDIVDVELEGCTKKLTGKSGVYSAKTVIIANGGKAKPIGCPGETELVGKGVSYCATCDAGFFSDLEVFVIGGGDAAVEEAIYLTKFARKVTIVHRRDELRAAKSIRDKAFANEKLAFLWDTVVEEISGDGMVESITFKNVKTNEITTHNADEEDGTFGIFPFIGFEPVSGLYKGKVEMDPAGYIITDDNMKTNVQGVFAAGDIRVKSLRQVVTAAADGAIAAVQAEKYIEGH